jgi:dihydroorotate dehydrogenase
VSARRRLLAAAAGGSLRLLQRLDPERAHELGLASLKLSRPLWPELHPPARLALRCFGLRLAHPLGLAAGFDKNGDYLDALGAMGFAHVELGTVTPRAQPGNPKPRMFRLPQACALVNRMGFNNRGVDHLVAQLERSGYGGVRGVSIGKNADTPLENAADDYLDCLRKVYPHADYVAVNVSSPNTARLRELQQRDGLERILGTLLDARAGLAARYGKTVPLLVKVAPELDPDQIRMLAGTLRSFGIDGVIATNTSSELAAPYLEGLGSPGGGLSGAPLQSKSLPVIAQLRAELGAAFPIIGVGGIMDAASARAVLDAGADLMQIYTGFAYRGQTLIEEILEMLSRRPLTDARSAEAAA